MNQQSAADERFLPKKGNYRDLHAYRKAAVVYNITYRFCHKFLSRGDRTVDQMIQAARSGKQNIVEGCKAGVVSAETELKLINVARSSLEELLEDYADYLAVHDKPAWAKNSREAMYVRKLGNDPALDYEMFREIVETRSPDVIANIAICLIHQTNYLLDHYITRLQADFVKQGGIRETMTQARLQYRNHQREKS